MNVGNETAKDKPIRFHANPDTLRQFCIRKGQSWYGQKFHCERFNVGGHFGDYAINVKINEVGTKAHDNQLKLGHTSVAVRQTEALCWFKKIIFLIEHKLEIVVHIFNSILKVIIFSSLWLILRLYPNNFIKNMFKMHHYVDLITLFSSNLSISSSTISKTLSTSLTTFSKTSSFPSLAYIKTISKSFYHALGY